MTASTRFWKRFNKEKFAPVSYSTSCNTMPDVAEPIQVRLRSDDDGPLKGAHFKVQLSVSDAKNLAASLLRYAEKLSKEAI